MGVFTLTGSSEPVPVQLQRGGVTANYTSQFVYLQPNTFALNHIRIMEMEHPYQFNQLRFGRWQPCRQHCEYVHDHSQ